MANRVDPAKMARYVSSGSALFAEVSVLVCRDEKVKQPVYRIKLNFRLGQSTRPSPSTSFFVLFPKLKKMLSG